MRLLRLSMHRAVGDVIVAKWLRAADEARRPDESLYVEIKTTQKQIHYFCLDFMNI